MEEESKDGDNDRQGQRWGLLIVMVSCIRLIVCLYRHRWMDGWMDGDGDLIIRSRY